tara:strand:+ start:180 stop:719 length:540 start_codon:yes stop_codon:yes gene_type:complete
MATIRAPLTTGLGNEQGMGWVGSAMPVVPIGYGGQQGLISHHLNPYLTPEGNVTVEGLQKARENQFNETGQPLGTGWGEPSGAELQQIIEGQNQSSNVPTSVTQSATAFPIGNMGYGPLIAQGQTNLLNPFQIQENMNKVDQVREGTYKGGKGGMVDKIFKNQSDRNSQLRQLMEQAGM